MRIRIRICIHIERIRCNQKKSVRKRKSIYAYILVDWFPIGVNEGQCRSSVILKFPFILVLGPIKTKTKILDVFPHFSTLHF